VVGGVVSVAGGVVVVPGSVAGGGAVVAPGPSAVVAGAVPEDGVPVEAPFAPVVVLAFVDSGVAGASSGDSPVKSMLTPNPTRANSPIVAASAT
jgi:hypothetical protein